MRARAIRIHDPENRNIWTYTKGRHDRLNVLGVKIQDRVEYGKFVFPKRLFASLVKLKERLELCLFVRMVIFGS